jgi:hypothetical protein
MAGKAEMKREIMKGWMMQMVVLEAMATTSLCLLPQALTPCLPD